MSERNLEITTLTKDTGERTFKDKKLSVNIKCSFNERICSPDCVSCDIRNYEVKSNMECWIPVCKTCEINYWPWPCKIYNKFCFPFPNEEKLLPNEEKIEIRTRAECKRGHILIGYIVKE